MLAVTFAVHGATRFAEPGVVMIFEESVDELAMNVASLGFDVPRLVENKQLVLDHVRVERSEIEETGEYDLEGLFVRLGHAIDSVGARRVVLDTLETLFAGLGNEGVLRAELRRLFAWLRERGVTAVVTAERGHAALTRHGLEEYVSDAVILLDHRVDEQISTRRVRIVKYRGSAHGTNEYPFLIDSGGISVLPITSLRLDHRASDERISTGIASLDDMFGGEGYYRGSTVLVSGTAGTGKTTVAAHFVEAACARGERCLYFLFEESPAQLTRNMRSIGVDLERWVEAGRLGFHALRPTAFGLEMHLAAMHEAVRRFRPTVTVVDPVTNLIAVGRQTDVRAMHTRLIDYLKTEAITTLFTSLTHNTLDLEQTDIAISSRMDTWLVLRAVEAGGVRRRELAIVKSRGMAHSNEVRGFRLTDGGVDFSPAGGGRGEGRAARRGRRR